MKRKINRTQVLILIAMTALVVAFQNCAPVGFSPNTGTASSKDVSASGTDPGANASGTIGVTPPATSDPAVRCACQHAGAEPSELFVNVVRIHVKSKDGHEKIVAGPGLIRAKDVAGCAKGKKDHDDDDVDVEVGAGTHALCDNGAVASVSVDISTLSHHVNVACHGGNHNSSGNGSGADNDDDDDAHRAQPIAGGCPSYPAPIGAGASSPLGAAISMNFMHH